MHTEELLHTQNEEQGEQAEQEPAAPVAEQEAGQAVEAQAPDAPEAEDEETRKTREKLMQLAREGKKPLLFTPPYSTQSSKNLSFGRDKLSALTERINTIRATVNEQNEHISGRLEALKDNPVVKIDSENKQAKDSVTQYTALLDRILEEIKFEDGLLERYASFEGKTVIPVMFHEPDSFDEYIHRKVGLVKKQIKKIERDLSVSFSRYQFSFEKQRKNLENIEALVSYNIKLREAAEKQAAQQKAESSEPVAAEAQ